MAVTLNVASVALGTSSTPLIEGSGSTTYGSAQNGVGFSNSSGFTGRRGCRIALAATTDFSTRSHVGFGLATTSFALPNALASVGNGGIRVVFVDSAGNYAGYNVYGSGIPNYSDNNFKRSNGFFSSFANVANGNDRPVSWQIDRLAPPAISSGFINWSQIVALELTVNVVNSTDANLYLGELRSIGDFVVTGSESVESVFGFVFNNDGDIGDRQHWTTNSFISQSANQVVYSAKMGYRIGDGSTATNFNSENVALGFFNTFDQSPAFRSVGPLLLLSADNTRELRINQSASDVFTLTDSSVSSAAWWQWIVEGSTSGTLTCTRVQFWRYSKFIAGHGQYIDCQFNGASAPVEVNGTSVILDGVIRDATTTALRVNTGPAIYDDLSLLFNNPTATADIELGSGGAGTYELPNIEVPAGYTLKIRNNSATNAVTVAIPTGITFSTSTAGGTINVITPSVTAEGSITNIVTGSRLQVYNETTATEVFNDIVVGTTYSNTYTEGTTFTTGDIVRIRLAYQSGTTAKIPVQYRTVATASGWSILADQQDDTVYIQNAIDGDTVTEFVDDFPNVEIDINDPDGVTTVQRGYAWYISGQMTADGIRFFHGGMTAEDDVNYRINVGVVDMKIQNINVNPVRVIGGRLYRSDGSTVITPGGGGVQMEYGRAYAVETGVSGLTPAESDRLMQTALEVTAQAAKDNAALAAALSA